jgi:hypothetical protein
MSSTKHDLSVFARLRGKLGGDLEKTGKKGNKAGKSIAGGFIKAQLALGGLKLAIKGTFRLFKSITTDAIREIDEIGKASEKLGVGVEFLSEMSHVADLAGTNLRVVKTGIRTLARNLLDAQRGSKDMVDSFTDLGLSMEDVDRLARGPLEDAFEVTIGQLGAMESGSKRVAIAQKLLGRSGAELGTIIKGGAREMRLAREDAERLGLSISASEFKLAAAANDAITRFTGSITGLKRTLALEFMPQITRGLEAVASFVAENRDEIVASVSSAVRSIGGMVLTALETASIGIADLVDSIQSITSGKALGRGVGMAGSILTGGVGVFSRAKLLGGDEHGPKGKAARKAFDDLRETLKKMEKLAKDLGKKTGNEWVKAIIAEVARDQAQLRRAAAEALRDMPVSPFDLPESGGGDRANLRRRGDGFFDIPAVRAMEFARPLREEVALIREKNDLAREMIRIDQEYSSLHARLGEIAGLTSEQWKEAAAAITAYVEARREQAREDQAGVAGVPSFGGGMKTAIEDIEKLTSPEALGTTAVNMASDTWLNLFDVITSGSGNAADAIKDMARSIVRDLARLAQQRLLMELLNVVIGGGGGGDATVVPAYAKGGLHLSRHLAVMGDVPEVTVPLSKLKPGIYDSGQGEGGNYQTNITVHAGAGTNGQEVAALVASKVDESLRRFRGFRKVLTSAGGL